MADAEMKAELQGLQAGELKEEKREEKQPEQGLKDF